MKLLFALLSFACGMGAQVSVLFTPESGTATATNFGKSKGIAIWTVMLSNDGPAAMTLSAEKIYMAAPAVPWFGPNRAQLLLSSSYANKPRNRAARILNFLGDNAEQGASVASVMMAARVVAASVSWQAGVAAAIPVLHRIGAFVNATEPPLAGLFGTLLAGPVTLAPGQGVTFTAFSSSMKSPVPAAAVLK